VSAGVDPGSKVAPAIPELSDLLDEAVAGGVAPGAAAAVLHRGRLIHDSAAGFAQQVPESIPLAEDTWFDLASLTKPLAVGLVALRLYTHGRLDLDAPVVDLVPTDVAHDWESIRITHLLEHRAGLPAWKPYFRELPALSPLFSGGTEAARTRAFAKGRAELPALALRERLISVAGEETLYSDIGFLALGRILEQVGKAPLETLFRREVRAPLGLTDIDYFDLRDPKPRARPACAATGLTRPRAPAPDQEEELAGMPLVPVGPRPGEVDDDNAFACGGVAGHAGLFGTPRAVARIGQAFLEAATAGGTLAPTAMARRFLGPGGGERGLSWERPTREGSSLGSHLGRGPLGAVGHLGFTGCSLWIDLDAELVVALCTNRTHLTRSNLAIRHFRPRFHDAVARAIGLG
jgi:CubicO group peptidase (beta-lactamase class C family)